MQTGWRIGSVFGIPLLLDSSWFLILVLVTLGYTSAWRGKDWGELNIWLSSLTMALLLFGSVLLHELGHSLVARSQGIRVSSITLFLFGGVASIDQESKTPLQAFQVAIAGPAVSFILFVILLLLQQVLPTDIPPAVMAADLARLNFVLFLFNMIPGLPLDGGQVLKAAIWKATGSRLKGVRWASRVGQLLGFSAILLSLFGLLTTFNPSLLWFALLGWFVLRNAIAYNQVTDLQEALLDVNASTAMTREFRVVDANLTIHQFTEQYLLKENAQAPAFFAASNGRYRGMVMVDELNQLERSEWDTQTLESVTRSLDDIPTVPESASLAEVVERLEADSLRLITVLSPAGAVAGVIDRGDLLRALMDRLKIPISSAFIQRIKDEGIFPPGLQLAAIAKTAKEDSAS